MLDYERKEVSVRYDRRNITTVIVYTRPINGEPGEFLGFIQASNFKREEISLAELNSINNKLPNEGIKFDHSSILNERLSPFEDVEQNPKERRRQRRK